MSFPNAVRCFSISSWINLGSLPSIIIRLSILSTSYARSSSEVFFMINSLKLSFNGVPFTEKPALSILILIFPSSMTTGMMQSSSIYKEAITVESTFPFILNIPCTTSAESIFTNLSPDGTFMKSIFPSSFDTEEIPSILYFFPHEAQIMAQKRKK